MWDRSLFLAHSTDWNKCSTSKNTQGTSWGRFWVLKVASKIWVLEQIQSAALCRVSHMTILSEFVRMMRARNQPCQASVTCLSSFWDWSCKLFYGPQDVRSSNSCHVQACQDNLWANFWQFSKWFQFLLFELMKFTVSLNAFFFACPSMS